MSTQKPSEKLEQALSSISLSSLMSGLASYKSTYFAIAKERGQFAARHLLTSEASFSLGISTYLYGVALSFFLYLPLMMRHGVELDKLHFLLQFCYVQIISILIIHVSVLIVRGKGSLSTAFAAYCCWIGIISPTLLVAGYPVFSRLPITDFINPAANPAVDIPGWASIWNLIVCVVFFIVSFQILLRWFSDIYRISKLRFILAFCLVYMPLMMLHNLLIAPHVAKLLEHVSKFLSVLI